MQRSSDIDREMSHSAATKMTVEKRMRFEALLARSSIQVANARQLVFSFWAALAEKRPDLSKLQRLGLDINTALTATNDLSPQPKQFSLLLVLPPLHGHERVVCLHELFPDVLEREGESNDSILLPGTSHLRGLELQLKNPLLFLFCLDLLGHCSYPLRKAVMVAAHRLHLPLKASFHRPEGRYLALHCLDHPVLFLVYALQTQYALFFLPCYRQRRPEEDRVALGNVHRGCAERHRG